MSVLVCVCKCEPDESNMCVVRACKLCVVNLQCFCGWLSSSVLAGLSLLLLLLVLFLLLLLLVVLLLLLLLLPGQIHVRTAVGARTHVASVRDRGCV